MHCAPVCVCVQCLDSDVAVHTNTDTFAPRCALPLAVCFQGDPRVAAHWSKGARDGVSGARSALFPVTLLTPRMRGGSNTWERRQRWSVRVSRYAKYGGLVAETRLIFFVGTQGPKRAASGECEQPCLRFRTNLKVLTSFSLNNVQLPKQHNPPHIISSSTMMISFLSFPPQLCFFPPPHLL